MVKSVLRLIQDFIESRSDEIENDLAKNNQDFKDLTLRIIDSLDVINKSISPENHKLLEELEDLRTQRDSIVTEAIYRKGLCDGIKIESIIHNVRSRDIKQFDKLQDGVRRLY